MENLLNEHYENGLHLYKYLLNTHKYQIAYNGLSNKSVTVHSNLDRVQDLIKDSSSVFN